MERAAPFSSAEIMVLVRIMDKYVHGPYPSNIDKLAAYTRIRRIIRRKFGINRTIVQLQRRWSDLRRRQRPLLESMRRTLASKRRRRQTRPVVEEEEEQEEGEEPEEEQNVEQEEEQEDPEVEQEEGEEPEAQPLPSK